MPIPLEGLTLSAQRAGEARKGQIGSSEPELSSNGGSGGWSWGQVVRLPAGEKKYPGGVEVAEQEAEKRARRPAGVRAVHRAGKMRSREWGWERRRDRRGGEDSWAWRCGLLWESR